MSWYNADIGTWKSGRVVEFEAENDTHAWAVANYLAMKAEREDVGVVQIRTGKHNEPGSKCIFDYLNGFYDRDLNK